jgi:ribosomal protein L14E/L6E/L27E
MAATKNKSLEYRGRPLRRKDNIIYYGSMADKYIVMLQILDTKVVKPAAGANPKTQEMKIATKVSIQLQLTDPDVKSRDRVVKKSEKESLYAAMDVASVWLERALTSR